MKMMLKLSLLVGALVLAGCASPPDMVRPGVPLTDQQKDAASCKAYALANTPVSFARWNGSENSIYVACMQSKGYALAH